MNGIFNNKAENQLLGVLAPKSKESVETAGSLAMNVFHSLFEVNNYDEFSSSNPFMVDYSLYADCCESGSCGGFLSAFSNALSTLGSTDGFTASSFGGFDCGSASSGSFTSVC